MRLILNKTVIIRHRSQSSPLALMLEESANKYGYKVIKPEKRILR